MSQPPEQDEVSRMDDFEVIAERYRLQIALAGLTDRYKRLNQEINGGRHFDG